jgi:hypothetical protein
MMIAAISCTVNTLHRDLILPLFVRPVRSATTAHINLAHMPAWKDAEQHMVSAI